MKKPEQNVNQDSLIEFLSKQLENYIKYHDSKENKLWVSFSLYLTFSTAFIYSWIKELRNLFICANQKIYVCAFLILVFGCTLWFILKQFHLKNLSDTITKVLRLAIIERKQEEFTYLEKSNYGFPDQIEERIKNQHNCDPPNRPEFPLILLIFLFLCVQVVILYFV